MKTTCGVLFARSGWALPLALLFTACQGMPARTVVEREALQGQWEGEGAGGPCTITITGDSLHYRNRAGWYRATFTLPVATEPRQLQATIRECSPPSPQAIGTVVFAIYKMEDGTLTLAEDDASDRPPESFDQATSRYVVRKVRS